MTNDVYNTAFSFSNKIPLRQKENFALPIPLFKGSYEGDQKWGNITVSIENPQYVGIYETAMWLKISD